MKLIGMMPIRNEDWVLGLSLRVALKWCDEMVVLLHGCTDRSVDIVIDTCRESVQRSGYNRIHISTSGGEWLEMEHRQRMLQLARLYGATHLAMVDADEVLTGNLIQILRGCIESGRPATNSMIELPGYNLREGLGVYHANGVWGHRWFSTVFAYDPALSWQGEQFHHREPFGKKFESFRPVEQGDGGIMHLWGASERRLIAKHALYKVTERILHPDKDIKKLEWEYSLSIKGDPAHPSYGTPATWTYAPVPSSWWEPYADLMKYLNLDAIPWQEAETRRLVEQHGRGFFSGLDLFGVA